MTSFTIPTVETDRLILRAPHLDDLPAMTAFFATVAQPYGGRT